MNKIRECHFRKYAYIKTALGNLASKQHNTFIEIFQSYEIKGFLYSVGEINIILLVWQGKQKWNTTRLVPKYYNMWHAVILDLGT